MYHLSPDKIHCLYVSLVHKIIVKVSLGLETRRTQKWSVCSESYQLMSHLQSGVESAAVSELYGGFNVYRICIPL